MKRLLHSDEHDLIGERVKQELANSFLLSDKEEEDKDESEEGDDRESKKKIPLKKAYLSRKPRPRDLIYSSVVKKTTLKPKANVHQQRNGQLRHVQSQHAFEVDIR